MSSMLPRMHDHVCLSPEIQRCGCLKKQVHAMRHMMSHSRPRWRQDIQPIELFLGYLCPGLAILISVEDKFRYIAIQRLEHSLLRRFEISCAVWRHPSVVKFVERASSLLGFSCCWTTPVVAVSYFRLFHPFQDIICAFVWLGISWGRLRWEQEPGNQQHYHQESGKALPSSYRRLFPPELQGKCGCIFCLLVCVFHWCVIGGSE